MESKQSNEIHRKHTRIKRTQIHFPRLFQNKQPASQPNTHHKIVHKHNIGRLNVAQRQRELENLQTICV